MREKTTRIELSLCFLHSALILLTVFCVLARLVSTSYTDPRTLALAYAYVGGSIAYALLVAYYKSKLQFYRLLLIESAALVLFAILAGVLIGNNVVPVAFETAIGGEISWTWILVLLLIVFLRRQTKEAPFQLRAFLPKLASVYSIGLLVLVDIIIWRRIEVFFLASSPDSVSGPAVVNMTLQYGMVIAMIPGAILEAWYPGLADSYIKDSSQVFEESLRTKLLKYSVAYLRV